METKADIEGILATCHRIAADVTQLHRAAGTLPDGAPRGEILKALFELTRQVEVVKKQVRRIGSASTAGGTDGPLV